MALTTTKQEYDELIAAAEAAIKELNTELSNISINVGRSSTDVLTAIKYIFGDQYINANGTSVITYEMFAKVTNALKSAGNLKVAEYL
jgi:hypothetical protein